jgi:hypothetical protein
MRCRLLNLLALLSLLLCVAVAVLWVRSYRTGSVAGFCTESSRDGWYRRIYCAAYSGQISFISLRQNVRTGTGASGFYARDDPDTAARPIRGLAGFAAQSPQGKDIGWTEVRVPHWFVVALLTAWPVVRFVRARRRTSDPAGFPAATP